MIDLSRYQDNDANASALRLQERGDHPLVRNKIGIRYQDRFFRRRDWKEIQEIILKTSSHRRAFDKLSRRIAARLQSREKPVSAEKGAGRFEPAVGKRGLQKLYRRPFNADTGISPVVLGAPVSQPRIAYSVTTCETDFSIDNQYPAVVAIIIFQQFPWKNDLRRSNAPEKFQLASRLSQHSRHLIRNFAAAMAVQQQVRFHPGPAAFRNIFNELIGERTGFKKVLGEGDGGFCLFDFTENRRKNAIAILQDIDPVAAGNGRIR